MQTQAQRQSHLHDVTEKNVEMRPRDKKVPIAQRCRRGLDTQKEEADVPIRSESPGREGKARAPGKCDSKNAPEMFSRKLCLRDTQRTTAWYYGRRTPAAQDDRKISTVSK